MKKVYDARKGMSLPKSIVNKVWKEFISRPMPSPERVLETYYEDGQYDRFRCVEPRKVHVSDRRVCPIQCQIRYNEGYIAGGYE